MNLTLDSMQLDVDLGLVAEEAEGFVVKTPTGILRDKHKVVLRVLHEHGHVTLFHLLAARPVVIAAHLHTIGIYTLQFLFLQDAFQSSQICHVDSLHFRSKFFLFLLLFNLDKVAPDFSP